MALTYRSTKGSPLTIEEIDNNFAYFTGSHSITGSLTISGSLIVSGSILSTEALQVSGAFALVWDFRVVGKICHEQNLNE